MTSPLDRRVVLAGAMALMAGPVLAETPDGLVRVAIKTAKGVITADLDVGKAPITAGNFLKYVDKRLFDGSTFYRASKAKGAPDIGVIEGGTRGDPAKSLKPIPHESTIKTGLLHKDGTLSMARRAPGTAAGDFFICIGDQQSFDARPDSPGEVGFAAFGQVVDGMDVARAILAAPTSPTAGVGVMRGEMLKPTVEIVSVRRVKA